MNTYLLLMELNSRAPNVYDDLTARCQQYKESCQITNSVYCVKTNESADQTFAAFSMVLPQGDKLMLVQVNEEGSSMIRLTPERFPPPIADWIHEHL